MLLVVVIEVPTGAFADLYGRKTSLMLAALFIVIACVIFGLGNNIWHFMIANIIFGLGVSLNSGADSAFIYDSLL
jgi:MFS family permease